MICYGSPCPTQLPENYDYDLHTFGYIIFTFTNWTAGNNSFVHHTLSHIGHPNVLYTVCFEHLIRKLQSMLRNNMQEITERNINMSQY